MTYLKALLFIIIAEILIYIGITFLSGQLLPVALEAVHREMPKWMKLLIFATIVSIPANLLISWGFQYTGPSYAGVVYAGSVIAGAMISAVLIDGARITFPAIIAFSIMLASAAWGIIVLRSTII